MTSFAPGIADRSNVGDLNTLPVDDLATLVRQRHLADRARLHEDLRIGTPAGMFSWALPKFLPEVENDKRLAIQQPLHDWSYNDFQGRLKHGYGKGTVSRIEKSPIVILKRSPSHLMFTRGDSKDAPIYNLVQTKDKNWLLSIKKEDQPAVIRSYSKEHFKSMPIEDVASLIDQGATITPKIDGAGVLALLKDKGIDVFGIRNNKGNVKPSYTDLIGNLRSIAIPKELQGTVLRGELYGTKANKVIHPNTLAGILNSTTLNAVNKRKADGIKLLMAATAVNRNGVDVYDPKEVAAVTNKLNSSFITAVPSYTGDAAKKLLDKIRNKQNVLTNEGVVVLQQGKRPVKAKNIEDHDVVIKDVFKADTDKDSRAGGFIYETADGQLGRVGTGFDYTTLRDMLKNPGDYIGRTARIHAQETLPSGLYRAPSFISMKED